MAVEVQIFPVRLVLLICLNIDRWTVTPLYQDKLDHLFLQAKAPGLSSQDNIAGLAKLEALRVVFIIEH